MKRLIGSGALLGAILGLSVGAHAQKVRELGWTDGSPPPVMGLGKAPAETMIVDNGCITLPPSDPQTAGRQLVGIAGMADDGGVFLHTAPGGSGTETDHILKRCGSDGLNWDYAMPVRLNKSDTLSVATDGAGNVYYASSFASPQSSVPDPQGYAVLVGKIAPSGSGVWTSTIDGHENETLPSIAVGSGKAPSIYVSSGSASQMPGHPPEARGYRFVAEFDSNGKRKWLRQSAIYSGRSGAESAYPPGSYIPVPPVLTATDPSGNVYLLMLARSEVHLLKLDGAGKVLWGAATLGLRSMRGMAIAPDGKSIYLVGESVNQGGGRDGRLVVLKVDANGLQQWARLVEPRHSVKIDPVEGVLWNGMYNGGNPNTPPLVAVTNSAVYVAIAYFNSYLHGSAPRQPHSDTLLLAFDQGRGKLNWARQYRVADSNHVVPKQLRAMPDGELVVAARTQHIGHHIVFRLRPNGDPVTTKKPVKQPQQKVK